MSDLQTLLVAFVAAFGLVAGAVVVGGIVLSDETTDQPTIDTDRWEYDTVVPDGADTGGDITMSSDEPTNTVVFHLGVPADDGAADPIIPIEGNDRQASTGTAGGPDRGVGPLVSTLVENGHEVRFFTGDEVGDPVFQDPAFEDPEVEGALDSALADADAFVTVSPELLSGDDLDTVREFTDDGGRVLVAADPGSSGDVSELGGPLGLYQEPGYLYNMADNDHNHLSIFAEPTGHNDLTVGVEEVVLRSAAPVGADGTTAALATDENTHLSTDQESGSYTVAAIADDLAIVGDSSFMSPENAYRADNNVLVGNVADFLVTGEVENGVDEDDRDPDDAGEGELDEDEVEALTDEFVNTSSPEAIVTSWYEFDNYTGAVIDETAVAVYQELLHSHSPLAEVFDDFEEPQNGEEFDFDVELERVDTEIVEEDLDEQQLEEELADQMEFLDLNEETIAELAAENAIVEATVTQSGEDAFEGELTERWLVAPEDDEWLLFVDLIPE